MNARLLLPALLLLAGLALPAPRALGALDPFSLGANVAQPRTTLLSGGGFALLADSGTYGSQVPAVWVFDAYTELLAGPVALASTSPDYYDAVHAIVPQDDGGFSVFWHRHYHSGALAGTQEIWGRRLSAMAVPFGPAVLAASQTTGYFYEVAAALAPNGATLLLYNDGLGKLWSRLLPADFADTNLTPLPAPQQVFAGADDYSRPTLLALPDNTFRLAWQTDGPVKVISFAAIDAAGALLGPAEDLAEFTAPDPDHAFDYFFGDPRLARDAFGNFILTVVFSDFSLHQNELFLVRFDPSGDPGPLDSVYSFAQRGSFSPGLYDDGSVVLLGHTQNPALTGEDLFLLSLNPSNQLTGLTPLATNDTDLFNSHFAFASGAYVVALGEENHASWPPAFSAHGIANLPSSDPSDPPVFLTPLTVTSAGSSGLTISLSSSSPATSGQLRFHPVSSPGSVTAEFAVSAIVPGVLRSFTLPLPVLNGAGLPAGVSLTSGTLTDGTYNLSFTTAALSSSVEDVVIDTVTGAPLLNVSSSLDLIEVSLETPEPALASQVSLTFSPQAGGTDSTFLFLHTGVQAGQVSSFSWPPYPGPSDLPGLISTSGPALFPGLYDVTLSYQDALGNPAATVTELAVAITISPSWPAFQAQYGLASLTGDQDNDGLAELFEFAFGTHPEMADTMADHLSQVMTSDRLGLRFTQDTTLPGVVYIVEASHGLHGPWTALYNSSTDFPGANSHGSQHQVLDSITSAAWTDGRRFLRLRVEFTVP